MLFDPSRNPVSTSWGTEFYCHADVIMSEKLRPSDKVLYIFLSAFMWRGGCTASDRELAYHLFIPEKDISKGLKILEKEGFIIIHYDGETRLISEEIKLPTERSKKTWEWMKEYVQ